MTLNRRKFTRIALIGGASFAASSGIFFPKPSEAFILGFLLRGLTARGVFGSLVRFGAGRVIRRALSGASGPSEEELLQIQLADKDFIERRFTQDKTQIAQAETTIFWGQQKQDKWGPNVGFGFLQEYQGEISTAKISGPTMTGIHVASQFLAKQGLSPSEVAGALMPVRSQFDDWGTWEGDNDPSIGASYGVGFTNYLTLLGEVTSRYDLIQPGRGGRGEIQLIVEAGGQPRRDIIVQVKFA